MDQQEYIQLENAIGARKYNIKMSCFPEEKGPAVKKIPHNHIIPSEKQLT